MRNFKINLSFVDCQGRNSDNVTVTNNDLRLVWPQIGVLCILDLHKSFYRPRASAAAYLWQLNYLRVPSLIIESWRFWGTELSCWKRVKSFHMRRLPLYSDRLTAQLMQIRGQYMMKFSSFTRQNKNMRLSQRWSSKL